jgi:hypothetical protein
MDEIDLNAKMEAREMESAGVWVAIRPEASGYLFVRAGTGMSSAREKRSRRKWSSGLATFPRIWDLMGFLVLPGSRQRTYPHVRDEMKRRYFVSRSTYRTRGARIFLSCCYGWWTVAAFFGIWKEAGLDKLIKWLKWVLPPLLWWKLTHWLRIG